LRSGHIHALKCSKNTYSVIFFTAVPRGLGCCEKATLSGGGHVAKKQHGCCQNATRDVAKKQRGCCQNATWMLPKSNTLSMAAVGIPEGRERGTGNRTARKRRERGTGNGELDGKETAGTKGYRDAGTETTFSRRRTRRRS